MIVIPAQAGIQTNRWMPAFAGMTFERSDVDSARAGGKRRFFYRLVERRMRVDGARDVF
jgi:hypothetical protein